MLSVRDVAVSFATRPVLDGVDLDVESRGVVALLGASGSGKSTLLRVIAGLLAPNRGSVCWDGQDLATVPPHRRQFGMLFQDHVLFPHRDVEGNIELGLRMQRRDASVRASARRRDARVGRAHRLRTAARHHAVRRRAATRGAGPALAPSPRSMLLDEPFGALDRPLRDRLVADVGDILRRTGVPAIVVTHDRDEAFALADRIGVLVDGRIVQQAPPAELWRQPVSEHVASLIGLGAGFDATVAGDRLLMQWGGSRCRGRCMPRVRREWCSARTCSAIDRDGSFDAVVRRVAPHGGRTMVELTVPGGDVVVGVAAARRRLARGGGCRARARPTPTRSSCSADRRCRRRISRPKRARRRRRPSARRASRTTSRRSRAGRTRRCSCHPTATRGDAGHLVGERFGVLGSHRDPPADRAHQHAARATERHDGDEEQCEPAARVNVVQHHRVVAARARRRDRRTVVVHPGAEAEQEEHRHTEHVTPFAARAG